jgi:hypothetical protein
MPATRRQPAAGQASTGGKAEYPYVADATGAEARPIIGRGLLVAPASQRFHPVALLARTSRKRNQKMGLLAANPKPLNEREPSWAVRSERTSPPIGVRQPNCRRPRRQPRKAGRLANVATVFHSPTSPIHSRSAPRTSRKAGACRRHAPLASPAATASDTSPETPLAAATASCHGKRRLRQGPSRPTSRSAQWPVGPFVVALVPGTTRSTPTDCDCLAAMPPRPEHGRCRAQAQLLLGPHSQTPAFQSPVRPETGTGDQAGR